jgi:hypothetical protein
VYDLGCRIIETRYRLKAQGKPYAKILLNFAKTI